MVRNPLVRTDTSTVSRTPITTAAGGIAGSATRTAVARRANAFTNPSLLVATMNRQPCRRHAWDNWLRMLDGSLMQMQHSRWCVLCGRWEMR